MYSIYDKQRFGKYLFFTIAIVAITVFLVISNNLVKELARQERERMDIWAKATERLAQADMEADLEFLLSIISQNNTIPVLVADSSFNILEQRNFSLPVKSDRQKFSYSDLSESSRDYLQKKLSHAAAGRPLSFLAKNNQHFIEVEVYENTHQYIYFEDSIVLRRLALYPYIELGVMIVLALIIYSAIIVSKRAEQNRVWVGLSKETAHQLGTPISSLMAWCQYMEMAGVDNEIVTEMNKDVTRLSTIAERFSKIGSKPELTPQSVNEVVKKSLQYMRSRISDKVEIELKLDPKDEKTMVSQSLFEWVMENLTKNAVDAMSGSGKITITTSREKDRIIIDVKDTGKGISRKNFKNVFNPGFTTKKRGWGLGLTLVKRIIEEYHRGRIYVKESEIGKGTTFRIELNPTK